MSTHYACEYDCGGTDCQGKTRVTSITNTDDPLRRAKDTIEWFAGRRLYKINEITLRIV